LGLARLRQFLSRQKRIALDTSVFIYQFEANRAVHRLRTPDALQAATAVHASAGGLVTNDPVFKRIPHFESIVLDEFL
jgi:predicted nucleic acid-binding protein